MGLLDTLAAPPAQAAPAAGFAPAARHEAPRGSGSRMPSRMPRTREARSVPSPAFRRARRILWRWRFALAALLFGLAATLTVHLLRPPPPPTVDVAVTTRSIAPGTLLSREDIEIRAVDADLAPPGVLLSWRDLLGRAAVVGLPAGAPLHATLVSDDGVSAAAPHGTVVVPVRLSDDAVADLLRPGDRVDLLAGTTSSSEPVGETRYLARGALVLPVPAAREPKDAGGLLGAAPDGEGPVTLVAVSPDDAPELSAVSGWGSVTAVLVP
ncbi:RcpC/CpaB family pilus assembly protein [Promicromonospora sukumoe]|uniref:Flp pilus assembly protein CpaB n=1 Tax=Promicromonospora sukumoe TaxID=88382 RepID=A0A7W3PFU8_9MICO|nr:RcpC/CpaB family pilus assembly protein [Promicromonospora sukumoe]MBA8810298.1 Flp pilus assembly protein CpaB [Promicromonospora sukumoe]